MEADWFLTDLSITSIHTWSRQALLFPPKLQVSKYCSDCRSREKKIQSNSSVTLKVTVQLKTTSFLQPRLRFHIWKPQEKHFDIFDLNKMFLWFPSSLKSSVRFSSKNWDGQKNTPAVILMNCPFKSAERVKEAKKTKRRGEIFTVTSFCSEETKRSSRLDFSAAPKNKRQKLICYLVAC